MADMPETVTINVRAQTESALFEKALRALIDDKIAACIDWVPSTLGTHLIVTGRIPDADKARIASIRPSHVPLLWRDTLEAPARADIEHDDAFRDRVYASAVGLGLMSIGQTALTASAKDLDYIASTLGLHRRSAAGWEASYDPSTDPDPAMVPAYRLREKDAEIARLNQDMDIMHANCMALAKQRDTAEAENATLRDALDMARAEDAREAARERHHARVAEMVRLVDADDFATMTPGVPTLGPTGLGVRPAPASDGADFTRWAVDALQRSARDNRPDDPRSAILARAIAAHPAPDAYGR